ncbi:MAG: sugar ABC transporter permease [Solirubrobacterales bacterium]
MAAGATIGRRRPAAERPAHSAPPRKLAQRIFGEHPTALLFIAPAVIVIIGLSVVPIVWTVLLSFKSSDLITPARWIGTANYHALMHDKEFGESIKHTLVYTVLFVPISTGLGLLLAMALNRRIRFIGIYRTAILAPFIVSITAQGVLFSFIFDQRFGVANSILAKLGLPTQGFLGDPSQAIYVIALIGIWGGVGFPLVVYLAALQDVPTELIDAASVDGARRGAILRHVILPQLWPVTIFLLVWQTLQALQLFELVYATTRGGPIESTVTIVYYIFHEAFQVFHAGYAAAVAVVVAVALVLLAGAQLGYNAYHRRRVAA